MTKYRKSCRYYRSINIRLYNYSSAWLTFKNETDYEVTSKDTQFRGTEVSRRSIASLAVRIAKNPELYSKENIGVNKPNTDGDKPLGSNNYSLYLFQTIVVIKFNK